MHVHARIFKNTLLNNIKLILLTASLGLLIGCEHSSTTAVIPATGVLKINGQPAEGVLVQFIPAADLGPNCPTSSGITDEEGKFTLVTSDHREGAVAGHGTVTLIDINQTRTEARGQEVITATSESPESPTPPADSRVRIPARYAIANKDSLKAEVKEDGTPIELEITSK